MKYHHGRKSSRADLARVAAWDLGPSYQVIMMFCDLLLEEALPCLLRQGRGPSQEGWTESFVRSRAGS